MVTQQDGGKFDTIPGWDKHIVLCGTNLRPTTMIDFLNEFYADASLQVCFR